MEFEGSKRSERRFPVVSPCSSQLRDVRPEDVLSGGLFRKCDTYRGGGGYGQLPQILEKGAEEKGRLEIPVCSSASWMCLELSLLLRNSGWSLGERLIERFGKKEAQGRWRECAGSYSTCCEGYFASGTCS